MIIFQTWEKCIEQNSKEFNTNLVNVAIFIWCKARTGSAFEMCKPAQMKSEVNISSF